MKNLKSSKRKATSYMKSESYFVMSDSLQQDGLYSLPGSSVHGILQARILQWVAVPSPGDLPDPGIEPRSSTLQEDSLPSEPPGKPSYIQGNLQNTISWFFSRNFTSQKGLAGYIQSAEREREREKKKQRYYQVYSTWQSYHSELSEREFPGQAKAKGVHHY